MGDNLQDRLMAIAAEVDNLHGPGMDGGDARKLGDRIREAASDASEHFRERAEAWEAVFSTLSEVAPGWYLPAGSPLDKACETIRSLAAAPQQAPAAPSPDVEAQARILTCVYCGHEYPQDTPAHGDKVLTDHIAGCAKHPLRAVIEQRDKLRDALAGVLGVSGPEELDAIELGVRSLPGCEEDRAVALNAIHALRACAEESK